MKQAFIQSLQQFNESYPERGKMVPFFFSSDGQAQLKRTGFPRRLQSRHNLDYAEFIPWTL